MISLFFFNLSNPIDPGLLDSMTFFFFPVSFNFVFLCLLHFLFFRRSPLTFLNPVQTKPPLFASIQLEFDSLT